jgi:Uncharacterized protein conserved in bacteria (DUF2330)
MQTRFHQRWSALGAVALVSTALISRSADACGGFFCSVQQPVNQAAERIIFADNGDGTITAVIQILYEGPSEHFSWLLPISSVPQTDQIAVASDLAFQRLQQATNPQYSLTTRVEGSCRGSQNFNESGAVPVLDVPSESCADNQYLAGCPNVGVSLEASGVVGAFEWSVISLDAALARPEDAAVEWLTANGYDVPSSAGGLLAPYLADGMYLLALRLTKGSDTGSIRPIVLTYTAEAPMIPIKLTAVAANEDMGVMTWALSSGRAVPFNYNALELNEARIDWFTGASNYNQVVTEAADEAGGQGFVTEFAGPSSQLAKVVWQDADEATWRSVQGGTYSSFRSLFQTTYDNYGTYDGFWDAVKSAVTLPNGISDADFRLCPTCYAGLTFSPSGYLAALEASVIEPMRSVQELIDRVPYTTRLYSTLSAGEMTLDPLFVFNPELPDLSNLHQATRVIECSRDVNESEAPWRIELPQGGSLRGSASTFGTWPVAVADQPANLRVLSLAASGEGAILADNAAVIDGKLEAYNGTQPPHPSGAGAVDSAGVSIVAHDSGCSFGPDQSAGRWGVGTLAGAVAALLALARRRPPH